MRIEKCGIDSFEALRVLFNIQYRNETCGMKPTENEIGEMYRVLKMESEGDIILSYGKKRGV